MRRRPAGREQKRRVENAGGWMGPASSKEEDAKECAQWGKQIQKSRHGGKAKRV